MPFSLNLDKYKSSLSRSSRSMPLSQFEQILSTPMRTTLYPWILTPRMCSSIAFGSLSGESLYSKQPGGTSLNPKSLKGVSGLLPTASFPVGETISRSHFPLEEHEDKSKALPGLTCKSDISMACQSPDAEKRSIFAPSALAFCPEAENVANAKRASTMRIQASLYLVNPAALSMSPPLFPLELAHRIPL